MRSNRSKKPNPERYAPEYGRAPVQGPPKPPPKGLKWRDALQNMTEALSTLRQAQADLHPLYTDGSALSADAGHFFNSNAVTIERLDSDIKTLQGFILENFQ